MNQTKLESLLNEAEAAVKAREPFATFSDSQGPIVSIQLEAQLALSRVRSEREALETVRKHMFIQLGMVLHAIAAIDSDLERLK